MDLKQKIPIYLSREDCYQCALLCELSAIALAQEAKKAPEKDQKLLLDLAEERRRISDALTFQAKLKE